MSRTVDQIKGKLNAAIEAKGRGLSRTLANQIEVLAHQTANLERALEAELAKRDANAEIEEQVDQHFEELFGDAGTR